MSIKEDVKYAEEMAKLRKYCSCGHSLTIPNFIDRKMCTHCGSWVYKDKSIEFKYKLDKALKRRNK